MAARLTVEISGRRTTTEAWSAGNWLGKVDRLGAPKPLHLGHDI